MWSGKAAEAVQGPVQANWPFACRVKLGILIRWLCRSARWFLLWRCAMVHGHGVHHTASEEGVYKLFDARKRVVFGPEAPMHAHMNGRPFQPLKPSHELLVIVLPN